MSPLLSRGFRAGCVLWFLTLAWAAAAPPALIPLPQLVQTNPGSFTLCPPQVISGAPAPAPTLLLADGAGRETAEYLATTLFKSTGYRFQVGTNSGIAPVPQAILLTTNSALSSLGLEGYELTVATDSVVIRAPAAAGLFYGVQTLLQLLPPDIYSARPAVGVPWTIPCVYIQDWPRFSWRGYMLDSVRHFFTPDEVKQLIDSMAMHKLNVFHWHLDDDSGWRLEILSWPLLHQVGAWRTDLNPVDPTSHIFGLNPRSLMPLRGDGLYGGYYTQEEARQIVQYAAQRHITVVPEIEMPGHSTSALAAYPQFSCNSTNNACPTCANGPYSMNVTSYVGGVFCIARPETTSFLHDVLTEVMSIFPGPYIHIGGDEVNFGNWNKHSLDQALTNSLGLTNTTGGSSAMQKYQGWFAQSIANWIKSQGRTMMGWSEIMNGGTVTNCALMDWLNTKALQAATNQEYVVMENSAVLYINKWETATNSSGGGVVWSNEPPGQAGLVLMTNVYAYEPTNSIPAAYATYIMGAEGPCWSEHIPSLLNMEFRMYPRLCAIAEMDWTVPALKDWTSFTNRLVTHKLRLDKAGINYNPYGAPPALGTWTPSVVPASYSVLNWNVTSLITNAGEFTASFCWKSGTNGLDIAYAALLENGVELDRDSHSSFTGTNNLIPPRPYYILRLPAWRPGATYTLSASVQGHGGTNSNGTIYRPNWD